MANRLNLPDDLSSLIEKREQKDRRQPENAADSPPDGQERRSGTDRRSENGEVDAESGR